jgi:hypothetical protein
VKVLETEPIVPKKATVWNRFSSWVFRNRTGKGFIREFFAKVSSKARWCASIGSICLTLASVLMPIGVLAMGVAAAAFALVWPLGYLAMKVAEWIGSKGVERTAAWPGNDEAWVKKKADA